MLLGRLSPVRPLRLRLRSMRWLRRLRVLQGRLKPNKFSARIPTVAEVR